MTVGAGRIAVALLVAAAGVAGLQLAVAARERALPRPVIAPAAAPSALAGLGFRLAPVAGVVQLAARLASFPPDVAPLLEVLADGSLAVRRPPPRAEGPLVAPGALGILVPAAPLGAWSAPARGALAEVLGAVVAERPWPEARLRCVDVTLGDDLATLLSWLP